MQTWLAYRQINSPVGEFFPHYNCTRNNYNFDWRETS